jgi:hypothetical protein
MMARKKEAMTTAKKGRPIYLIHTSDAHFATTSAPTPVNIGPSGWVFAGAGETFKADNDGYLEDRPPSPWGDGKSTMARISPPSPELEAAVEELEKLAARQSELEDKVADLAHELISSGKRVRVIP